MTTQRFARSIEHAVARLNLDLNDLVIYTEAGTGPFSLTPALAARAGAASVYAIAKPWGGATAAEAAREAMKVAEVLGVADRITIRYERCLPDFSDVDIVTNLGFVRPIDADVIAALKATATVAFMREPWERRDEDVDLSACAARGIPVLGTNEHDPSVGVFEDCGLLATKMLFEAGIEISGSTVVIVSGDAFGATLRQVLENLGARVWVFSDPAEAETMEAVTRADALVIADFTRADWVISSDGPILPAALAKHDTAVVAFAGGVDADALNRAGVTCIPRTGSRPFRMGCTLGYLGPRPVAMLHGAGLQVGAAAARARRQGLTGDALARHVCAVSPAAPLAP